MLGQESSHSAELPQLHNCCFCSLVSSEARSKGKGRHTKLEGVWRKHLFFLRSWSWSHRHWAHSTHKVRVLASKFTRTRSSRACKVVDADNELILIPKRGWEDGGEPWLSLRKLLKQLQDTKTRACVQIYHQYVRLRKDFGRYPVFVDEGAEVSLPAELLLPP